MANYVPEIGQMFFGCPTGEFDMPPYACSMLDGLMEEFDRVYWNTFQKQWNHDEAVTLGGVVFRPYWWGDEDAPEASMPNFQLDGDAIEIRWYKHARRGQSVNVDLTPGQWAAWHDRIYRALLMHEYARDHIGMRHPDECYRWHVEPVESPGTNAAVDPVAANQHEPTTRA